MGAAATETDGAEPRHSDMQALGRPMGAQLLTEHLLGLLRRETAQPGRRLDAGRGRRTPACVTRVV